MYQPIIEMFMDEMKMQNEGTILKAVRDVGVFVSKEELVEALAYDRGQYEKGYQDGLDKGHERLAKKIESICEQLRVKIIESEECPRFERAFRQVAFEEALDIILMEMSK